MKGLVLAAGYATRLYPLTKNQPKPLLEVAGKSILDYTVEKMDRVDTIDEIIIVTNEKFTPHFTEWANQANYSKKITVVNDQTTTNENRLGAIGDIQFVIDELDLKDDLMVFAGDSIFDFELTDFAAYFDEVSTDIVGAYLEENEGQRKRAGIVEIDENSKVLSFEEKPKQPKSPYAAPAFYPFKVETLPEFKNYLDEGFNADAPGHFIPYLIKKKNVHVFKFNERYDIGTLESYERAQKLFDSDRQE